MVENLKRILRQEDTVLFVGSGVSLWSGLPSWPGLIHELIEFLKINGLDHSIIEQELKRGELLQAASYGFDKLTKPQIAEFIRRACRLGKVKPHDIHQKIISLGPNCYITTNYDKLIELSFQRWLPENYFRTVINRQLTETAEIVGARANNFLFKLHGDVEDSESIILTREQYRTLNYGGELHHALETTKTLMLSRPIVYIGFGLRDPDFLYLKDLLINTYKGGARDHYAIMADVGEQEKDYWKRNFGIHIISYNTIINDDGKKDHSPILSLLDSLKLPLKDKNKLKQPSAVVDAEFVLNLARHASKYLDFENSKSHIPLIVHPLETNNKRKNDYFLYQHYCESIENILDKGPEKIILIGLPGGGKSYSLRSSAERFAKKLNRECIDGSLKSHITTIPIYVDLKLYQGNINELLEQNIPIGMNLDFLFSNFKVKIYLDAFNEMPREYIESNHWNSDFSGLLEKVSTSIIVSSRTSDGLENLELPIFNLDSIDKEFVELGLNKNKLLLKGIFKDEIISILQRPFFYKLIFENGFKIDAETSPQKIYSDLISLINQRFQNRFQIDLNLVVPLSNAAMDAIDHGEEAYKIGILSKYISIELKNSKNETLSPTTIINWLVSQNFLIPIINERICFFHQSVTEYLAATKLATMFVCNNDILKEKLSFRRWDQALFLTLSLLDINQAPIFLETIINIDFELALSSVRYMEGETKFIVDRLLLEMKSRASVGFDRMSQISHILEDKVPLSEFHVSTLKKLIKVGNSLGGAAVSRLLEILEYSFTEEALTLLVDNCNDFNFCTHIGRSLRKYVTVDDLTKLLIITNQVQEKVPLKGTKKYEGFDSSLGELMKDFDPTLVYETFFDPSIDKKNQKVRIDVLCEFLRDCRNNEGLKISANLLLAGIDEAATEIYFITHFCRPEDHIDFSIFQLDHIKSLLAIAKGKKSENAEWALSAINSICSKREDFIPYILESSKKYDGVFKAALLYCASSKTGYKLVFESLEELLKLDSIKLSKEPFSLIGHMDQINWVGQELLFIKLLKLRNIKLAYNLCDQLNDFREPQQQLVFDIGPIYWWLDWFTEYFDSKSKDWMFIDRVPSFIARHISKEKRQEFIDEFNKPDSLYWKTINRTIIRKLDDITIDDLSEEAIIYSLNELKNSRVNHWNTTILTDIATERFVTERLMPILKCAKGIELENLKEVIDSIGKKHKRRYIIN